MMIKNIYATKMYYVKIDLRRPRWAARASARINGGVSLLRSFRRDIRSVTIATEKKFYIAHRHCLMGVTLLYRGHDTILRCGRNAENFRSIRCRAAARYIVLECSARDDSVGEIAARPRSPVERTETTTPSWIAREVSRSHL